MSLAQQLWLMALVMIRKKKWTTCKLIDNIKVVIILRLNETVMKFQTNLIVASNGARGAYGAYGGQSNNQSIT